jgi:hypothetical protein
MVAPLCVQEAAEKGHVGRRSVPQGLKPLILTALMYGLKSVPFKTEAVSEFFRKLLDLS